MTPSGYEQQPILTYVPSARDPNLSLRLARDARTIRLDVTAPLDRPLKGRLSASFTNGWSIDLGDGAVDLPPGGILSRTFKVKRPPNPRGRYDATLTLERPDAPPLVLRQPYFL